MRNCKFLVVLGLLTLLAALELTLRPGLAQIPIDPDEQTLKSAGFTPDNEGLFEFFRRRSMKDEDRQRMQDLVRKLGSDVYRERIQAEKELLMRGPLSIPFLQAALKDNVLELVRRSEQLIKKIETTNGPEQPVAAARLLARRQTPGAIPILLNYLPYNKDPWVEDEVLSCLGTLTVRSGKVDPLLLNALKDKLPERRAAAVYVLARRGDLDQRETVRHMLTDADPLVRLRVAQGLAGKRALENVQDTAAMDETLLKNHKIDTGEPGLVAELSRRTLSEDKQNHIKQLIRQLGSDSYRERVDATKKLIKEDSPALAFLQEADSQPGQSLEASRRIGECVGKIKKGPGPALPIAAIRLLARDVQVKDHSPAAGIRVLLGYAPFAEDSTVEEEVLTSLSVLSAREVKIDPLMLSALQDPLPARRAAAAFVLGRMGTREHILAIRKLLDDPHPAVKLRASQGLIAAKDKAAVPHLIALLTKAAPTTVWQVEELLQRIAGDKAPIEPVGDATDVARQKAAKAWENWWLAQGSSLDLTRLDDSEVRLGLLTICEYDSATGRPGGQAWEAGPDRKPRWKINNNMVGPMDAQVLPSGRILVAENSAQRVTERDMAGNIKWEYRTPGGNPITAQRLPNGNTFIATYNQVMEITPNQKEVYNHNRGPNFYIFSAQKMRNGHIVCATALGTVIELDSATGKEIRTLSIGQNGGWCSVEAQPNGRYLVANMIGQGQVRELDASGKTLMSFDYPGVFRATRLPNGNILVASMTTRKIAEFDRTGTTKRWEHTCEGRPWSIRYR